MTCWATTVQVLNILSAGGWVCPQDGLFQRVGEGCGMGWTDGTAVGLSNDLAYIADIGGDDGDVAGHGFLDNIG